MFQDIILIIKDRAFPSDKGDTVLVIEHTHFIRCHQLSAGQLKVGREVPSESVASAVGVGINGGFAKLFGNIFVSRLLVTPEIYKLVAVADDTLPLLFKESLELSQVLQNDTYRHTS